ncbi:methyl-accepting chemotaxis protein [Paludibacterium paludis]|uniref:Chemotaxis transducer n=1 Tax=Paludibacterium paludis TaxID=1225769 RepID=A0A918P6Z4_9NEIS|nr:methyl-accepting chemotaxis protein [Paludibacterium paludis]GGY29083.1 chemotaxis transducer [Paludibacterium paludis]
MRTRFFSTARGKILTGSALLIFIGIGLLVGLFVRNSYRHAEDTVLNESRMLAEQEAGTIQRRLERSYHATQSLANAALALRSRLPANGRAILADIVRRQLSGDPDAIGYWAIWEPDAFDGPDARHAGQPENDKTGRAGVYWFNKAGRTDVVWGAEGVDDSDYYARPKQSGKPYLTEPYTDPDIKVLMGTLSVPLVIDGKVAGIVGCDLSLDHLRDLAARIRPYDTGYMSLYSNKALLLAGHDPARAGKPDTSLPADASRAIASGKHYDYQSGDGWLHFLVPVRVGDTEGPWAVRISIPLDRALAPVREMVWQSLLVGIAILAGTLLLMGLMVHRLLTPLNRLEHAMTTLSAGSGDLTRQLDAGSQDEIGRSAAAFNQFTASLHDMMLEVRDTADSIQAAGTQLTHDIGRIVASSGTQSEAARATAQRIEALSHSVARIAGAVGQTEKSTELSDVLSGHAADKVMTASREITRIADTVRHLAGTVGELDDRTGQIGSIAGVIRDIADQTNLLALNAAIEAARAGEQGRGFAVVADEVRKLAERTAVATREITAMIGTIQEESRTVASNVEGALALVDRGVALTQDVAETIEQIRRHARDVATAMGGTARATAEQSEVSQEIASHIDAILAMLRQTDDAVKAAGNLAGTLDAEGHALTRLIGRFRL